MSQKKLEELEMENIARGHFSLTYKDLSSKEKVIYIWDYYKLHIIGAIIGVVFLVSIIATIVTNINTITLVDVTVISRDFDAQVGAQLQEKWISELVDDTDKKTQVLPFENISISENLDPTSQMTYNSKLTAKLTARMLDVMIMEKDFFEDNYDAGLFADLSTLMDLKAMGVPEEDWYYVNDQVLAINVSDYAEINQLTYNDTDLYLSIFSEGAHVDNSIKIIEDIVSN